MALTSDKPLIWGAASAVVAAAIVLYLYAHRQGPPTPAVDSSAEVHSTPAALAPVASAPIIEHPIPDSSGPTGAPLPVLNESDQPFNDALTTLPGAQALQKLLVPDNLIRHIVVTVDNLSKKKLAIEQRPLAPTSGKFMVIGTGDQLTLDPQNYARYQPVMEVVKLVDTRSLVQLYFHFYPLFQNAFDDLGYQDAYFNDHLIAQIDHLLATPDVTGSVALVQPNVMYRYADPALEALSPGQKTLIRMGPANEALIKSRLRDLKTQLLAHPRAPG